MYLWDILATNPGAAGRAGRADRAGGAGEESSPVQRNLNLSDEKGELLQTSA